MSIQIFALTWYFSTIYGRLDRPASRLEEESPFLVGALSGFGFGAYELDYEENILRKEEHRI
jgi:hypothetical protein